jgi:hypothetical protein
MLIGLRLSRIMLTERETYRHGLGDGPQQLNPSHQEPDAQKDVAKIRDAKHHASLKIAFSSPPF